MTQGIASGRCTMAHHRATQPIAAFTFALAGFMLGIGLLGAGALARKPYSDREDLEARTMDHLKGHSEESRKLHTETEVRTDTDPKIPQGQGQGPALCLPVRRHDHTCLCSMS